MVQALAVVDQQDKREALRHLLRAENVRNALIFCNRKRDVDILHRSLAKHGFDAAALHGDMAQSRRTETLDRFRNGEIAILVASDVAARGLDIEGLSHVFNFDVPIHAEDYIHRIGRTGRAGREGHAFTLACQGDGTLRRGDREDAGQVRSRASRSRAFPTVGFEEADGRRGRGPVHPVRARAARAGERRAPGRASGRPREEARDERPRSRSSPSPRSPSPSSSSPKRRRPPSSQPPPTITRPNTTRKTRLLTQSRRIAESPGAPHRGEAYAATEPPCRRQIGERRSRSPRRRIPTAITTSP